MEGVDEHLLQVQRRVQQAGVELRGEGLGGAGVVVGGRHEPGGEEAPRVELEAGGREDGRADQGGAGPDTELETT